MTDNNKNLGAVVLFKNYMTGKTIPNGEQKLVVIDDLRFYTTPIFIDGIKKCIEYLRIKD